MSDTEKVDKISFENAIKSPFWQIIAAVDPFRKIDVRMDYCDLKMIVDLIDKEAKSRRRKMARLIDVDLMIEILEECKQMDHEPLTQKVADAMIRMAKLTPTADAVEVVHGEWIEEVDTADCEYIECSVCGSMFYDGDNDTFDRLYNYCPNCGAKMDGGK